MRTSLASMRFALLLSQIANVAWSQTFTELPASPFPTGLGPTAVAAGYFTDVAFRYSRDLAIVNRDGNSVSVLQNSWDSSDQATRLYGYTPSAPYPVGVGPVAIAVADFDSNGALDLAVANSDGTVTVLLSTAPPFPGRLTFTQAPGSPIRTSLSQSSIASGDFNGDGKPDLAITNQVANTVTILLGDGLGGFSPAPGSPFPAGSDPRFVLAADLNGDLRPDLAIANGFSGGVTILLGNGSGGFTAAPGSPFLVGSLPRSLSVGDFNKDGRVDLAVANQGSNNVSVLLGDGRGGFTGAPGSPFAAGNSPVSVVVADFAHHGNLDIAAVSESENAVNFLLGDGLGGFTRGNSYPTGAAPAMAAVLDRNGDGVLDLAIVNKASGNVTVLLNASGGGPKWYINETSTVTTFVPGQTGVPYTYEISNIGQRPTSGGATVTFTPPPGFTLVSMSGNGWACLRNICTRGDVPSLGSPYPQIAIALNAGLNVPYTASSDITVSGGGAPALSQTDNRYYFLASGVYVSSSPVAVPVVLDGMAGTTPLAILPNTGRHTVTVPVLAQGSPGAKYIFSMWGSTAFLPFSRTLDLDSSLPRSSYTAYYTAQYQLTAQVTPVAAGAVFPPSGGYYTAGTPVSVSVSPSLSTFQFSNWSGGVVSPALASSSVTMDGPKTLSANFIPISSFFVRQLYRDLLTREPDPAGLSYWQGLIDNGRLPREVVASSLFTSPEFVQSGLYVIKLYVGVLGRDPDFGGWLNWFTGLRNGAAPSSVLNAFLASAEFQNTYGSLSNSDFVNLVYRNVLQRPPDPGGLANWLGQLNSGVITRGDVMGAFVNGPEFDNLIRSRAYANLLYMGFLRRTPDPAGLTYWNGILAAGNPLSGAIYGFINGPEYLNRLASVAP